MIYPRSRGRDLSGVHGSDDMFIVIVLFRFIPAHAGETISAFVAQSDAMIYPRSRGRDYPESNFICIRGDLSSLTRERPDAGTFSNNSA